MAGRRGMTVSLVSPQERTGEPVACACCGLRYRVEKTMMLLRDGVLLYGEICPECVVAGPAGAAMRLRNRDSRRTLPDGVARSAPARSALRRCDEHAARKLALLADTDSFPLRARLVAVRELRVKR